eukprot:scaffold34619_cov183-Amphora_coffeaeformis.AAC.2
METTCSAIVNNRSGVLITRFIRKNLAAEELQLSISPGTITLGDNRRHLNRFPIHLQNMICNRKAYDDASDMNVPIAQVLMGAVEDQSHERIYG